MVKAYSWAKKIHRTLVLIIITLSILMAGTGLLMKYSLTWLGNDLSKIRYLHNQLSLIFAAVLLLMIITGFAIYLLPYLIARKAKIQQQK